MQNKILILGEAWVKLDEEDFDRIAKLNWFLVKRPSGLMHVARKFEGSTIFMHHEVLQKRPTIFEVDHIDGDGLNNCKANLRWVTRSENVVNTERIRKARLIEKHGNRYRVRVNRDGERKQLGSFETLEEARSFVQEFKVAEQNFNFR